MSSLTVSPSRIVSTIPAMVPAINPLKGIYSGRLGLPLESAALLAKWEIPLDRLLTVDNPKTLKKSDRARTAILHHSPSNWLSRAISPTNGANGVRGYLPELAAIIARNGLTDLASRHNGCPWATDSCRDCCLNASGHGGISQDVANCRGRRTVAMIDNPPAYAKAVLWAIARERSRTLSTVPLATRLKGTDDSLLWQTRFSLSATEAKFLADRFGLTVYCGPSLTLTEAMGPSIGNGRIVPYDYSAAPLHGANGLLAQRAAGYDITHSVKPDRASAVTRAIAAIRAGFRVAIPVAMSEHDPIPPFLSFTSDSDSIIIPTVNGDLSDHRFLDPHGCAVILRYKISRGANPISVARFAIPNHGAIQLADGIVGWA